MRYKLEELYETPSEFKELCLEYYIENYVQNDNYALMMELDDYDDVLTFISSAVWNYFYDDKVAYKGEDANDVKNTFYRRIGYDVCIKMPYWFTKYNYIKRLEGQVTDQINLLQTSKVTSSSNDNTDSASGSLQKIATTPTGVSVDSATDGFEITIDNGDNSVATTGFVDKYTNTQQKYASSNKIVGTRSGEINREGSVEDLLKVLEKLPSSFANEITKDLAKHFIFDYDGDNKGLYDED